MVAPKAGGQGLDLDVGAVRDALASAGAVDEHVERRVVENRRRGREAADELGELGREARLRVGLEALEGLDVVGGETVFRAVGAGRVGVVGEGLEKDDVVEQAVELAVAVEQLAGVRLHVVLIIGMQPVVEAPAAGQARLAEAAVVALGEGAVGAHLAPPGAEVGDGFLPRHGGVNRAANALAVEGLDHLAEEVALAEGGVGDAGFRRIVAHAMVAFCEDRHAVDARAFDGRGEGAGIELDAHVGDVRRGVKI